MSDFTPISLGRPSSVDYGNAVCSPAGCEPGCPSVYLSNPKLIGLPQEGTITFKFKRGPMTIREKTRSSPGTAESSFQLLEIVDVTGEEVEDGYDSPEPAQAGDAIDALFNSVQADAGADVEDEG